VSLSPKQRGTSGNGEGTGSTDNDGVARSTPANPITPSSPPRSGVPRPNSRPPINFSERPPPANLLEVRRPSAAPIPREEPDAPRRRDVIDVPPPAAVPAEVVGWSGVETPPPTRVVEVEARAEARVEARSESPAPKQVVEVEARPTSTRPPPAKVDPAPAAQNTAMVRARSLRTEELIREPSSPFGGGEDGPEGLATEEQLDNFRELRTRLLAMAAGLDLARFTTLIVPMTSGAGGSFVARNLAAAFALQDGRAAMLVDCNMKHPTQHEAFGTSPVGLFNFLDEPDVQYDSLLRRTGIPALHLIPAGSARSKFREYFSSAPMRALMDAVRKSEYFVFLDGPPAMGSPDARILSEFADFVILVVGYGSGTAEEIAQTAALFDPAKFAGVVFNERG
jgi:protein-tyrosine kinase